MKSLPDVLSTALVARVGRNGFDLRCACDFLVGHRTPHRSYLARRRSDLPSQEQATAEAFLRLGLAYEWLVFLDGFTNNWPDCIVYPRQRGQKEVERLKRLVERSGDLDARRKLARGYWYRPHQGHSKYRGASPAWNTKKEKELFADPDRVVTLPTEDIRTWVRRDQLEFQAWIMQCPYCHRNVDLPPTLLD
jgi:hypothetical protein